MTAKEQSEMRTRVPEWVTSKLTIDAFSSIKRDDIWQRAKRDLGFSDSQNTRFLSTLGTVFSELGWNVRLLPRGRGASSIDKAYSGIAFKPDAFSSSRARDRNSSNLTHTPPALNTASNAEPDFVVDLTSSESVIVISDTPNTDVTQENTSAKKREPPEEKPVPQPVPAADSTIEAKPESGEVENSALERRVSIEEGEIRADSDLEDDKDDDTLVDMSNEPENTVEDESLAELRKQVFESMQRNMAPPQAPATVRAISPTLRRKYRNESVSSDRRRAAHSRARSIFNTRRPVTKQHKPVTPSTQSASRKRKAAPASASSSQTGNGKASAKDARAKSSRRGSNANESESEDLLRARLLASLARKRREKYEAEVRCPHLSSVASCCQYFVACPEFLAH